MSSTDAVARVAAELRNATSFTMIFGALPGGDLATKKRALRSQFAYLVNLVHPDHVPAHLEGQAREAFRNLTDLRRAAEMAIEADTYDRPFSSTSGNGADLKGVELQSPKGTYRLAADPFRIGDFSVLYYGSLGDGKEGVIAKIASDPTHNPWLEREVEILKRFGSVAPPSKISRYVPEVLDAFLVSGPGGKRFRVTIMRRVSQLVSVSDIIEAYPKGLAPPDAAWVFRRILAQTLAAGMIDVVHGGITPDHVLVDPVKHEPLHIGWAHAIKEPWNTRARITHVVDRFRDYYPPEVFAKKSPDHRSDIYMAGKTMIALLGGDVSDSSLPRSVPNEMGKVILRCVEKKPASRWPDGRQAMDEFTRVIRGLWGKAYRPLSMPTR